MSQTSKGLHTQTGQEAHEETPSPSWPLLDRGSKAGCSCIWAEDGAARLHTHQLLGHVWGLACSLLKRFVYSSHAKDRGCKAQADPRVPKEVLQEDSEAAPQVHCTLALHVISLASSIGFEKCLSGLWEVCLGPEYGFDLVCRLCVIQNISTCHCKRW